MTAASERKDMKARKAERELSSETLCPDKGHRKPEISRMAIFTALHFPEPRCPEMLSKSPARDEASDAFSQR